MNKRWMLVVVVGLFFATAVKAQAPLGTPNDLLGDPLPGGAVARLGTMRFKHDPATGTVVNTVAFSPDGKKIASMGLRGNVSLRLWDAATGQQISGP